MWRKLKDKIDSEMDNLAALQKCGVFEFFGPRPDRREETESLIKWLDENTPPEVLAIAEAITRESNTFLTNKLAATFFNSGSYKFKYQREFKRIV